MSHSRIHSIDVLLPFHEVNDYLFQAIESILRSKNVQVHLLLIDDRIDKSVQLILRDNQTLISTPGGIGYYGALNLSKDYLRSDYVALANSDDLVHPSRFSLQVESIMKHSSDISICRIEKFHNFIVSPSKLGTLPRDLPVSVSNLFGSYGANATWCLTSEYFRKSINFENVNMGDWLLGIRLGLKPKYSVVQKKLYFYRQHRRQTTEIHNYHARGLKKIYQPWAELNVQLGFEPLFPSTFDKFILPFTNNVTLKKSEIAEFLNWANRVLIYHPSARHLILPRVIYTMTFVKKSDGGNLQLALFLLKNFIAFIKYSASLLPRTNINLLRELMR